MHTSSLKQMNSESAPELIQEMIPDLSELVSLNTVLLALQGRCDAESSHDEYVRKALHSSSPTTRAEPWLGGAC